MFPFRLPNPSVNSVLETSGEREKQDSPPSTPLSLCVVMSFLSNSFLRTLFFAQISPPSLPSSLTVYSFSSSLNPSSPLWKEGGGGEEATFAKKEGGSWRWVDGLRHKLYKKQHLLLPSPLRPFVPCKSSSSLSRDFIILKIYSLPAESPLAYAVVASWHGMACRLSPPPTDVSRMHFVQSSVVVLPRLTFFPRICLGVEVCMQKPSNLFRLSSGPHVDVVDWNHHAIFFCSQIFCILQQKGTKHQFRKTKKASKKCFFTFSPADLGKSVPSVRACSVKFLRPPLKVREKSGGDVFNATSSSSLEIFSLFLLSTLKSCFPPCRSFASAVGLGHLKGGRFSRA